MRKAGRTDVLTADWMENRRKAREREGERETGGKVRQKARESLSPLVSGY